MKLLNKFNQASHINLCNNLIRDLQAKAVEHASVEVILRYYNEADNVFSFYAQTSVLSKETKKLLVSFKVGSLTCYLAKPHTKLLLENGILTREGRIGCVFTQKDIPHTKVELNYEAT